MVAKLVKNLSSFRFLFVCVQAGTLAFGFDVAGRYAERWVNSKQLRDNF